MGGYYKEIQTFSKCTRPDVNVIGWLEFQLTYYDDAILHVNHYTTGTARVSTKKERGEIFRWA